MSVGWLAMSTIALMRCAHCKAIMNQSERERSPRTEDGRPIHERCQALLAPSKPEP